MDTQHSMKPDPQDVETNKIIAMLAYLIFFLPLIAAKDSKFAMYHANQGLLLFLAGIAVSILGMIPFIGGFLIFPLGSLAVFVLAVLGIIGAYKGEMKPLPVIGKYELIK